MHIVIIFSSFACRHVDNYLDFYDDCFLYTFQPSSHQADSASSSNSAARATRQEARP